MSAACADDNAPNDNAQIPAVTIATTLRMANSPWSTNQATWSARTGQ
jgi:hypothetical protein